MGRKDENTLKSCQDNIVLVYNQRLKELEQYFINIQEETIANIKLFLLNNELVNPLLIDSKYTYIRGIDFTNESTKKIQKLQDLFDVAWGVLDNREQIEGKDCLINRQTFLKRLFKFKRRYKI